MAIFYHQKCKIATVYLWENPLITHKSLKIIFKIPLGIFGK